MNKIVKILRKLDHPVLSLAVRNTAIVLIVVILSFLTLNYFTQRPRAEAPVSVMPTQVAVLSPLASISFGYSPVPLYIPLVPAPSLEPPSPVAEVIIETTTYIPTEEPSISADPTTISTPPTTEPPVAVAPADVPEDTSPPETVAPTRTPRPRSTTPQPSPTPTPAPTTTPNEEEPTTLPTLEVIWQDLTDWISDTFTIDLQSNSQQNKVQDTDKGDKENSKVKATDQDDEKGKAHGKDSNKGKDTEKSGDKAKDQDKDSGKGKKGQDKD